MLHQDQPNGVSTRDLAYTLPIPLFLLIDTTMMVYRGDACVRMQIVLFLVIIGSVFYLCTIMSSGLIRDRPFLHTYHDGLKFRSEINRVEFHWGLLLLALATVTGAAIIASLYIFFVAILTQTCLSDRFTVYVQFRISVTIIWIIINACSVGCSRNFVVEETLLLN